MSEGEMTPDKLFDFVKASGLIALIVQTVRKLDLKTVRSEIAWSSSLLSSKSSCTAIDRLTEQRIKESKLVLFLGEQLAVHALSVDEEKKLHREMTEHMSVNSGRPRA